MGGGGSFLMVDGWLFAGEGVSFAQMWWMDGFLVVLVINCCVLKRLAKTAHRGANF